MVNKLIYQGRLTADPELKRTQSDVSNMEFTIAWSEKYKESETKCFLRCKAWRNTAEFIDKYFNLLAIAFTVLLVGSFILVGKFL